MSYQDVQKKHADLVEIAQRFGYADVDEAKQHIEFAGRWLQKNQGKQQPAHIKRAIDALVAFQLHQVEVRVGIERRIAKLQRDPRIFFGAIVNGARFVRLRRTVRRVLGLYLSFDQMADHLAAILPPDAGRHYEALTNDRDKLQSIGQFAKAADVIYGFYETGPRDGKGPDDVALAAIERQLA